MVQQFKTRKKDKQVFPVGKGKEYRKTDNIDTENKRHSRIFKGTRFTLYDDSYVSKEQAQVEASKIRKEIGIKVRVKHFPNTGWGVWEEANKKSIKNNAGVVQVTKKEEFMSYSDYQKKQKDLQAKIKEANQRIEFAYSNMGQVDKDAEKRQQKYIKESEELQKKAEAYSKKHPDWIKGKKMTGKMADKREQEATQKSRVYTPIKWEKSGDIEQTEDHTIAKGNYSDLNKKYHGVMSTLGRHKTEEITIEARDIKDISAVSVTKANKKEFVKLHNSYFNKKLVYTSLQEKTREKIINKDGSVNKNRVGEKHVVTIWYNQNADDMYPVAMEGKDQKEFYVIAPVNPDNIE